jgi:hypothetical protein
VAEERPALLGYVEAEGERYRRNRHCAHVVIGARVRRLKLTVAGEPGARHAHVAARPTGTGATTCIRLALSLVGA